MSNQSLLERAFQIADSGLASSATHIRRKLAEEGYTHGDLAQLGLPSLAKQLSGRIRMARGAKPKSVCQPEKLARPRPVALRRITRRRPF